MTLHKRTLLSAAIAATLIAPAAFAGIGGRGTTMIQDRGLTSSPISLEIDHEMQGMAGLRLSQYANLRAHLGHQATVSTINASGAPARTSSSSSLGTTVLADWTFEVTGIAVPAGTTHTYGAADSGQNKVGSVASGTNNTVTTAWSFPTGNGSAQSYNQNNWSIGDYWQFTLSTAGYQGVFVTFDQGSSATGPRDFKLQYTTNGTTYTDAPSGAYSVINVVTNATSTNNWITSTLRTTSSFTFDLSGISALNNNATTGFRLIDTSAINPAGGAVAGGGTDRIDNFIVTATPVPEPSTYLGAALALVAIGWMQRRRLLSLVGIA